MKVASFFLISLLAGCSSQINRLGYQKIDEANNKIAQIEAQKNDQIKEIENKTFVAQNNIALKQFEEMQDAANELYLANYGFSFYTNPVRLDLIINNSVKRAGAFLPPPTYEFIVKANEELKTELDTTKTTLADLQNKFNAAQIMANKLKSEIDQDKSIIQNTEKEKNDIINDADKKIKNENQKKDDSIKGLLNDAQDKLNKAFNAQRQKLLIYIISVCLIVGLISGAVAIYVPIARKGAGIFSAICLSIAICLPFVSEWMVIVVFGIGMIFLIYELAAKLHLTNKVNTNLIGAVQQVKNTAPDIYNNNLKPILTDMNSKYQNVKGEIKTSIDASVEKYIDSKLMEMNLK